MSLGGWDAERAVASAHGYEGILAPSAALPGTNLVVLPRNLSEPAPLRVIRSTELALETIAQQRQR